MKKLALLLGLVICTVAASTAYATTRGHAGSPPAPRPGEVLIESESGVYIDAPRAVRETTSPAAARPAEQEPASSSDQRPLVRPGEVLIENESGVYIDAPPAVRETTSPAAARRVTRPQYLVSPEQQVAKAEAQKHVTRPQYPVSPEQQVAKAEAQKS